MGKEKRGVGGDSQMHSLRKDKLQPGSGRRQPHEADGSGHAAFWQSGDLSEEYKEYDDYDGRLRFYIVYRGGKISQWLWEELLRKTRDAVIKFLGTQGLSDKLFTVISLI